VTAPARPDAARWWARVPAAYESGWTPALGVRGGAGHGCQPSGYDHQRTRREDDAVPSKSANVKNEKQYEALKGKVMSKQRAAKIANSPDASKVGGKQSGFGGDSSQGGTTAQKRKAGRKGGKAAAKKG
jgi:hypothetical protein